MPSLRESLDGKDLGHLALVAECWGIALEWSNKKEGAAILARKILDKGLFREMYQALPTESQSALTLLKSRGAKLPWPQFERQFGVVRALGQAQRDKLQPQRDPVSTAERLWYRAMLGRAFLDEGQGPQEHAYLPNEFIELVPGGSDATMKTLGRLAKPSERERTRSAQDRVLDELTSLLAAKRSGINLEEAADLEKWKIAPPLLVALATVMGLLDENEELRLEGIEGFLTETRSKVLGELARAWKDSPEFNELHLLPGLQAEGHWSNSPRDARKFVLSTLFSSGNDRWVHLDTFIQDIKMQHPDFQRTGGEYEAWFLKDVASGEFLRGFDSWEHVEGALIRFVIQGPAYWLGLVELGFERGKQRASAFRLQSFAGDVLDEADYPEPAEEKGSLNIDSQGLIQAPVHFSRAVRYQISRFCEWEGLKKGQYRYRIGAKSLKRAKQQGLSASRLLPILEKHADSSLAPNLVQAIQGWEQGGSAGRADQLLVLRLRSPEILEALRKSRANRYLVEVLGPNAVVIKPGAMQQVRRALSELGYLAEFEIENQE